MASLHKDPRGKSPFFYCAFTLPDGRRTFRSTKLTDRKKAWEVCLQWEKAAASLSNSRVLPHPFVGCIPAAFAARLSPKPVRNAFPTNVRDSDSVLADRYGNGGRGVRIERPRGRAWLRLIACLLK